MVATRIVENKNNIEFIEVGHCKKVKQCSLKKFAKLKLYSTIGVEGNHRSKVTNYKQHLETFGGTGTAQVLLLLTYICLVYRRAR